MESREQMPSVIARLMGLDELVPQPPVQKGQRVLSDYYLQRVASIGVREKQSVREQFMMSIEEQEQLNYIFRVLDKLNRSKHHNLSVEDGKPSSSLDAKCISLNKKLENQKELQGAMEIRDSKKLDSESAHPVTSSCDLYNSKIGDCRNFARRTLQGNVKLLQKCETGLVGNSYGELGFDNKFEFLRSRLESNNGHHPKDIVILKPNHGQMENGARCFSSHSSDKGSVLGDWKLKNIPDPENRKVHIEVKERKNLAQDIEPTRQWPGVSSRTSGEATRQTRHGIIGNSRRVSRSGLSVNGTSAKEAEMMLPSNSMSRYRSRFPFSHDSYVTRKAERRVSGQWKMNNTSQKDTPAGQVSTLGELLAIPCDGSGTRKVDYKPNKYGLHNQTGPKGGHVNSANHLDIISSDGLKDGAVRNISRSKSPPASSSATRSNRIKTGYEGLQSDWYLSLEESVNLAVHEPRKQSLNQKYDAEYGNISSYKKSFSYPHLDLESDHIVEEIRMVIDEVKNKPEKGLSNEDFVGLQSSRSCFSYSDLGTNHIVQDTRVVEAKLNKKPENNMSEKNALIPMPSVLGFSLETLGTKVVTNPESNTVGRPCGDYKEEQLGPPRVMLETNSDSSHAMDSLIQQDASVGFNEEGSVFSQCSCTEQESVLSSEEAYHPSPVSVLEAPFKEEISSGSEFLESVGTDICDFSETHSEGPGIIVSSDEDSEQGSTDDPEEKKDIMRCFRVEESRDFSYLIDIITEAGFHGGILHLDLGTWHSQECPISLSIFETLEKKFGEQASWKRPERRLLFDRINSGLMEILQPCMGIPKWAKPASKRFNPRLRQDMIEEELWMLLVSQEKELSKDPIAKVLEKELGSLDLGEEIDLIGREIERLLIDELAVEVFSLDIF